MRVFWIILASLTLITEGLSAVNVVSDYGAVGDAQQLYMGATSNSVILTATNSVSAADIGKAIEVFRGGIRMVGVNSYGTNGTNWADCVAMITNVVGASVYISQIVSNTGTLFVTYGHDNRTNFQNAISAASGSSTTINVPVGNYLILCPSNPIIQTSIGLVLYGGGISFVGTNAANTVLLSQGAYTLQGDTGDVNNNYGVRRGFLFAVKTPITNDYPVRFEGLTLDGGVLQGNLDVHGAYPNPVDGLGWDTSHGAISIRDSGHSVAFSQMLWTNMIVRRWRGEMLKSNDNSTNGNLNLFNSTFSDGNATAINIYASLNISNCVFDNFWQVAEYYLAYNTNTCYFQNNLVTNITGNAFALNGGTGVNPHFIIRSNTWYFNSPGYNGIQTTPAANVYIYGNQFISQNNRHHQVIVLGSAGYQGTFPNSNIVVAYNSFYNPYQVLQISGGLNASAPERVESVYMFSNSIMASASFDATPLGIFTYHWTRNVQFEFNDFSGVTNGSTAFLTGADGAQFISIPLNNTYYTLLYDQTNYISYGNGSRYKAISPINPGAEYVLVTTNANQIPTGAQILVQNSSQNSAVLPVYLNSQLSGDPDYIASSEYKTYSWNGSSWISDTLNVSSAHFQTLILR